MRRLALAAAGCLLAAGPAAAHAAADLAAVRDTSTVDQTGARLLRDVVMIHASPRAVWKALTDQAAYRAWVAPASFVEFRVGGAVEVAFDPNGKAGDPGNLKQEIVAYMPERLIVFRNVQNPGPGGAAYRRLAIVLELAPVDGGTQVSLSQVGYRTGPEFDAMYDFFGTHNPEFLADLKAFAEVRR
ncbi:MAG: SRPBCC domain-containing protein [Phenylobacterium sp.]